MRATNGNWFGSSISGAALSSLAAIVLFAGSGCEDDGSPVADTQDSLPSWASLASVYVTALGESGVRYTAAETGTYRFEIEDDAWRASSPRSNPLRPDLWAWTTEVYIFKNRAAKWKEGLNDQHPDMATPDFSFGDDDQFVYRDDAVAAGKGLYVDLSLEAGDYLILIVPEEMGLFGDSSGGVQLDVQILR